MGASAPAPLLLRLLATVAGLVVHAPHPMWRASPASSCSRGVLPQPPPGSRWDPSRSSRRCTGAGKPAVCPVGKPGASPLCDCGWTGHEPHAEAGAWCNAARDDDSACDCYCCCRHYPSDGTTCGYGAGHYHSASAPGSLQPGEICTAVCQPGFTPKSWGAPYEAFSCSGATGELEPTNHISTFACVAAADTTRRCGEQPPCEGSGCEWTPACTSPGTPNGMCVAQCRPGYEASSGPQTEKYYCTDLGNDWKFHSANPLICKLACPGLPPQPHQHWRTGGATDIASCGDPPYTSDQRCKVGCDAGFHLADGADPNCRADGDAWLPRSCPFANIRCCSGLANACGAAREQGSAECTDCVHSQLNGTASSCGCVGAQPHAWCGTKPGTNPDRVGWYECKGDGSWSLDSE